MTEQSPSHSSTDAQAASVGLHPVLERLRGGLIASAQAYPGEPMRDPRTMDQVAQACVAGGAVGVRAQGLADLALICQHVDVPVIGLWKDGHDGVFITPPSPMPSPWPPLEARSWRWTGRGAPVPTD